MGKFSVVNNNHWVWSAQGLGTVGGMGKGEGGHVGLGEKWILAVRLDPNSYPQAGRLWSGALRFVKPISVVQVWAAP